MGTRVGELRESLMQAIEMVKKGDLLSADASAIASLAAQISASLHVEAKLRQLDISLGKLPLGSLPIGEESTVEMEPIHTKLPGIAETDAEATRKRLATTTAV